jgi:hypothetical protein
MVGTLALVASATAGQFIVVSEKIRKRRLFDAVIDLSIATVISTLYAGTLGGMAIAMVASVLFSIYLYFRPIPEPSIDINMNYIWVTMIVIFALSTMIVANIYWATIASYIVTLV